ncbi:ribonuclease H-like domain-containing protein [Tanacetum coccineum]
MPPTPDLSFIGLDEFVNKSVVENCKSMSSEEEPKVVTKNDDAPCIEEWVSDDEEEDVSQPKIEKKIVRPSIVKKEFVKSKQQEKTTRKTVKQVEQHRQNTYSPRGNQRNWNNMMSQKLGSNFEIFNKACYVCRSFDHLQVDCNYHQKQFQNQRIVKPVWNNAQRVNHQNFAKKTHPCAKKNLVPRAVLMKSGLLSINTARQNISKTAVLVNTARQVNVAHSKTIVNAARPMSYLSKISHLNVKRAIHKNTTFKNNNINQRVNTVRGKKFNTARPKAVVNDWLVQRANSSKNGVTERRNRTLIEAARTMLADFMLPTTFWAEAVNTACYVQNRVLVVKPHNKTPYELFHGRTPTLSFMRPFRCLVTILNTIDHLGKFDGKAFRVFNSRTRIVEENLHIRFSESTPNVVGSRPDWLFDIDALTRIMNYEPIVAGTQSNGFAGRTQKGNSCIEGSKLDNGYAGRASTIQVTRSLDFRKAKKSVKLMMEKLFRMELELMLVKTINGEAQLHALVDGKKIIITEASVRRDLQLADEEGVDCLPNSTIFEQLTLMGV